MVELNRMREARTGGRLTAALTLLEVMVAMGILSVGLLAASAAHIHAMAGGKTGRHTTAGAAIAHTQIEDFQRMLYTDPSLAQTPGWVPVGGQPVTTVVQANPVNRIEQVYNLQWRITDIGVNGTLKAIDVRVTWAEPNRPRRDVTVSTIRHNDPVSSS